MRDTARSCPITTNMPTETLSLSALNLHPFLLDSEIDSDTRAERLKKLLLDLSKDESVKKDFGSILREAADRVREKAFGFNRGVTKRKIINLIREFEICEMDDFTDEFNLPKKEIFAALDELERENKIVVGRRRRWQEAGKHYNLIYRLV